MVSLVSRRSSRSILQPWMRYFWPMKCSHRCQLWPTAYTTYIHQWKGLLTAWLKWLYMVLSTGWCHSPWAVISIWVNRLPLTASVENNLNPSYGGHVAITGFPGPLPRPYLSLLAQVWRNNLLRVCVSIKGPLGNRHQDRVKNTRDLLRVKTVTCEGMRKSLQTVMQIWNQ